jgi:hypothetical protein
MLRAMASPLLMPVSEAAASAAGASGAGMHGASARLPPRVLAPARRAAPWALSCVLPLRGAAAGPLRASSRDLSAQAAFAAAPAPLSTAHGGASSPGAQPGDSVVVKNPPVSASRAARRVPAQLLRAAPLLRGRSLRPPAARARA